MKSMAFHLISKIAVKLKGVCENDAFVRQLDEFVEMSNNTTIVNMAIIFPPLAKLFAFLANNYKGLSSSKHILNKIHAQINEEVNNGLAYLSGAKISKKLSGIYDNEPKAV